MGDTLRPDLCVIGAGSGGLSVAAGAVQMGASVVLLERAKMGGDCLNYGCVPSKALLAAGKHAHAHRTGAPFGVAADVPEVDWARVRDHVHSVIAAIAPHDSVERFEGLGVQVIQAGGRFISPRVVQAGEAQIRARRFIVSTGSSPSAPPIPGLADVPFLTNETVFDNAVRPERMIVIGAGPIGMEMAQAHRRLGAEVVVLEAFRALGRDDPELAPILLERLRNEGIEIREEVKITSVAHQEGRFTVTFEGGETLEGSHLLVAAGRRPNLDGLDAEAGGIRTTRAGIEVDATLRSVSNKRVYAIGDVAGGYQFTHVAGYHAGIVIRNTLFRMRAKARTDHIPWVTYTDPEMAHAGLSEAQARERWGDRCQVLRWPYSENDRAQAERATEGLAKAMLDPSGRVVGASIVGAQAGELIQVWALAISARMKIGALAGFVAPYPTFGEVNKRMAGSYYTPKLFSDRTRKVVRFLARFG